VYEAERNSPYAAVLEQLVSPPAREAKPTPSRDARWDAVRAALAARGAPFWDRSRDEVAVETSLEDLLAEACVLSRRDPTVAKVLPFMFVRTKDELHLDLVVPDPPGQSS